MSKIRTSQSLESGWSFRQTDRQDDWLDVKKVPTNVHLDLMDHKLYIPASSRGYLSRMRLTTPGSPIHSWTSTKWPSNGSTRNPGPTG
jgi:hypothetical protein